jgi:hypothetical protein
MACDPGHLKAFFRAAKYYLARADTVGARDCLESILEEHMTDIDRSQALILGQSCEAIDESLAEVEKFLDAGDADGISSVLARAPLAPLAPNVPRLRLACVAARLFVDDADRALRLSQGWAAEEQEEPEMAWTALGRCHLWMCNVDGVIELGAQSPHAVNSSIVCLAKAVRQSKSKGNVLFQVKDPLWLARASRHCTSSLK